MRYSYEAVNKDNFFKGKNMEELIKEKNEKKNSESKEELTTDEIKAKAEPDEEELENPLKIEIGKRFRKFREEIKKAQHELAAELNIYQSTITNIERGKTFPNIRYLQHFYKKYQLNINWLLTNEGDMLVFHYHTNPNALSVMDCHLNYNDPRYMQYAELFNYMQVPEIEQVILSRLTESKAIFKDQIADYFTKKQAKEESEDI
ncbi:MAG TPA: XRE family transcriptional regulator [Candidatus Kapabacteria bacterium]|nr:XRE family transcriptional regulator [Candidatus Kapabacteria bacterium]